MPKGRRPGAKPMPPKPPVRQSDRPYIPLRRPNRSPSPAPAFDSAALERALAAGNLGEPITISLPEQPIVVRATPTALALVQQSGLTPEQVERALAYLARKLSSPETVAQLPPWKEHPPYSVYQTALGTDEATYVFTFVLTIEEGQTGVLLVAGDLYRSRRR